MKTVASKLIRATARIMEFSSHVRHPWNRCVYVGFVCFSAMLAGVYIVSNTSSPVRVTIPAMPTVFPSRKVANVPEIIDTSANTEKMFRRGQLLKQRCRKVRGDNLKAPTATTIPLSVQQMIIVNDQYKVLFCWIPKIACSNFKRMFALLSGHLNETDPKKISHEQAHTTYAQKYLRFLSEYSGSEVNHRLKHYRKVMFVREPFERLLSAYRDKFDTGTGYWKLKQGYVDYIKKNFRKNQSVKGKVTLDEFVRYVISKEETHGELDIHWRQYTHLCHPCAMQYDLIGKYDNIIDEGNAFLDGIGAPTPIRFPERNGNHSKTADEMHKLYKDIDSLNLRKLKALYADDANLFGYEFPSVLEPYLNMSVSETVDNLPL